MEEEVVKLYNSYTDEEATPLECILFFKKLVQPRGYCTQEELKKLISDYIDFNVIGGIV